MDMDTAPNRTQWRKPSEPKEEAAQFVAHANLAREARQIEEAEANLAPRVDQMPEAGRVDRR